MIDPAADGTYKPANISKMEGALPAPLAGTPARVGAKLVFPLSNGVLAYAALPWNGKDIIPGPNWRHREVSPQAPGHVTFLEKDQFITTDGGRGAHWRAIKDDKGRIVVAISHNSDLGDAWEFADSPYYPEKESALAIRIAVNDVIYAMTH